MSFAPVRALEFYSGIGGLHYAALLAPRLFAARARATASSSAASASLVSLASPASPWTVDTAAASSTPLFPAVHVLDSFEINAVANEVYEHNFRKRPQQTSISSLTPADLDRYRADLFLLSPPCQPYTRLGLQRDQEDARAESFHHLFSSLLPRLAHPPRFLLLENVQCFENSQSCSFALAQLRALHYSCEQFLLSPRQFGIPNQRSRFFLLATRRESGEADSAPAAASACASSAPLLHHIPASPLFVPPAALPEDERAAWQDPDAAFATRLCDIPAPSHSSPTYFATAASTAVSVPAEEEKEDSASTSPAVPLPSTPAAPPRLPMTSAPAPAADAPLPAQLPLPLAAFLEDEQDLSPWSLAQAAALPATASASSSASSASSTSSAAPASAAPASPLAPAPPAAELLLPAALLGRSAAWCLDLVRPSSRTSTCVTKAYTTYLKGTGSVLQTAETALSAPLAARGLRFLSPREIANLHAFPPEPSSSSSSSSSSSPPPLPLRAEKRKRASSSSSSSSSTSSAAPLEPTPCAWDLAPVSSEVTFSFPASLGRKQRCKLLGNSLNVLVVAHLLLRLLDPAASPASSPSSSPSPSPSSTIQ